MITMIRLVTAAAALATLCSAQENVKATYLGNGAEYEGKKIEMTNQGEVAYLLSFTAGKEFEAGISAEALALSSHSTGSGASTNNSAVSGAPWFHRKQHNPHQQHPPTQHPPRQHPPTRSS
jgi:hypothetical protein